MKPLVQVGTASSGNTVSSNFIVPIPDSRLRVKISILWIPAVLPLVLQHATLWLFESDVDDSGQRGDNVPLVNIYGTSAAPIPVPGDPALSGYSREFTTASDNIEGRLTVESEGNAGYWILQTRYQPQAYRLGEEEWAMIIAQCNPQAQAMIQLA